MSLPAVLRRSRQNHLRSSWKTCETSAKHQSYARQIRICTWWRHHHYVWNGEQQWIQTSNRSQLQTGNGLKASQAIVLYAHAPNIPKMMAFIIIRQYQNKRKHASYRVSFQAWLYNTSVCNRFRTRSIPHSDTCYVAPLVEPRILLSSHYRVL